MRDGFHDRFQAALDGDDMALADWCAGPAAAAGLSVYRNTIAKGCADALVAQFPTVERVVGVAWLTAAATAHAADHPPRRPSLLTYGDGFPDWLAGFPPATEMPFLAGLARLDLLWTEAHLAADSPPLNPAEVAELRPADFSARALTLHPATRFEAFGDTTPSLWQALQPPGDPPAAFELEPRPEALLFVRPGLDIEAQVIGAGTLAFLAASRDGSSLADAAMAALTVEPGLDLSDTFARLVSAGAFATLRTLS